MRPTLAGLILTVCLAGLTPTWSTAQTSAEQEFLFAYRLMQRGDLAEAGVAFDEFLRKFPQDGARGDALYFRAALYRQAGALHAAAELLEGATGSATPQRVPGYAVQLLRGQVLTDLGDFGRALEVLETVDASALPAQAEASVALLRAMAYRGAGNFDAAARAAEQAASGPGVGGATLARARLEQGRAEAAAGRPDAARAALDQAIAADAAQDPRVAAEAARLAGDVAYAVGDYDDAARYFQRVIETGQTSPEFPAAVVGRMWADLQAGRNVAVVDTHKQLGDALAPPAGDPRLAREADYLAASAYQNLGQQAQAVEMLSQVVDRGTPATDPQAPDDAGVRPLALYKLAVGQYELTRYDDMARTVAQLEREFPRSPQQVDASFLLASADANQGRAEAGVARLKSFIDDGPDNPYFTQALLRRAALLSQSDELAAAADDLQRYLDTAGDGADPAVRLRLADLQHRLGDYDRAINTAGQVLADSRAAQTPAVAQEAWYRLGEAQTRAGQYRQALASFDKLQQEHPINPYRHAVELRRGLLLQQLGQTDQAMAVLIEAGNDERLPTPQRVAALRIIASHLRQQGRVEDAALTLRQIEKLAGLDALDDDELLWLARQEVATQEADGAREALRTLAVIDGQRRALAGEEAGPREAELRFLRGQAHLTLGQLEEAYRNFFGVVALGQGLDLEARLYLARTEAARGNLDAALMELSDLQGAPDSRIQAEAMYDKGLLHRRRAELLTRRGDTAGATEQWTQARTALKRMVLLFLTVDALRPLPERGLVQLAQIAEALEEPQARDKELNELTRAFPDSPYAQFGRSLLDELSRRRPDDALVRLQRMDRAALDPVLAGWVDEKVAALEAMR